MTTTPHTCDLIMTRSGSLPVRRIIQLVVVIDAAIAVWSVLLVRLVMERSLSFDAAAPQWAYDRYVGLAILAGAAFVLLAAGARLYAIRRAIPWSRVPLKLLINCAVMYAIITLVEHYYNRSTFGQLLLSRRAVFFALLLMYIAGTLAHYARRQWLVPPPPSDTNH